jgi:TonB family protein
MQNIVDFLSDLHLDFKKCVIVSISIHVAIVLFLTVRLLVFPSEPLIIQNSIRVDVVDMPDKVSTLPEEKPAEPAPEVKAKPEVKPPPPEPEAKPKTVDLKKDKTKQLDAINKLKQMSAFDKLKESKEEPKPAAPQFKGNILNAGDSLTGIEKIQFDDYFSKLKSHVREHWDLPQWLANANLSAQAGVQIDEQGFVIKKQLLKSSGNEIFDEKVISTLDKCSPFPPPPNRLRDVVRARGIVFNFP